MLESVLGANGRSRVRQHERLQLERGRPADRPQLRDHRRRNRQVPSPDPYSGQIGDGPTQTKRVVTVAGLQGVTAISTSDFYTYAVLSGDLRYWGINQLGQLGDGTTETRFQPVTVRGIAKPASGKAPLDEFAGQWGGHERVLRITPTVQATMVVDVSCCIHVINLAFRLSDVHGTYTSTSARAQITQVHVFDKSFFLRRGAPHVGQVRTLRLNDGVITEPFLGEDYCDAARGQTGYCGA